ncbi:cell division protein FtsQ/DivIB [Streptomyces sp. TP-A0874]|uniref:cell division protein FtsQ/DivIB n=1 Tax=Streptomyces sp. TP-A0874 TaxID=549819 RepID=UPI0008536B56|nr:FtsQ-type POTRA domain-containing protein [Streptomyces sp. TP-A0874]
MAGPRPNRRGASGSPRSGSLAPERPNAAGGEAGARRPPRLDRRRVVWGALAIALLCACSVWLLYGSQWLRVERLEVRGADVLTESELRTVAAVPERAPMISVDTAAVAERLRGRLPRIDTVEVVRSWPHTVRLEVAERQAEAVVAEDGKFVEVDDGGVRFGTLEKAPGGVPLLEVDAARSPSLRRFGERRLEREAVQVVAGMPAALHRRIQVIRVRSYDYITFELTSGQLVEWGSGERGARKAETLLALLKSEPDAERFDVRAPSAPAVLTG